MGMPFDSPARVPWVQNRYCGLEKQCQLSKSERSRSPPIKITPPADWPTQPDSNDFFVFYGLRPLLLLNIPAVDFLIPAGLRTRSQIMGASGNVAEFFSLYGPDFSRRMSTFAVVERP